MAANLHFSIFRCQTPGGEIIWLDLASITSLGVMSDGFLSVWQGESASWELDQYNGEALIAAWNRYKFASSAAQLIKTSEIQNPTIACNSAFRIDEYLGFLAGEKLKELAELAELAEKQPA